MSLLLQFVNAGSAPPSEDFAVTTETADAAETSAAAPAIDLPPPQDAALQGKNTDAKPTAPQSQGSENAVEAQAQSAPAQPQPPLMQAQPAQPQPAAASVQEAAQAATEALGPVQSATASAAATLQLQTQRAGAPRTGKLETAADAGKADTIEANAFAQAMTQKSSAQAKAQAPAAAKETPALAIGAAADTSAPEPMAQQLSTLSSASTQTAPMQAVLDQTAARAAPVAAQVAREIVRKFDGGNTRFELRLDPPELGRIEVRLDVSRDQRVTAVVAADSPQALAELVRHARELEQALQSAGLELSENGLSFDLRQSAQDFEDAFDQTRASGDREGGAANGEETPAPLAAPARPIGYERWRGVRVDMMV
jgi:hypothetical protein